MAVEDGGGAVAVAVLKLGLVMPDVQQTGSPGRGQSEADSYLRVRPRTP
jgi:hypothetical protein